MPPELKVGPKKPTRHERAVSSVPRRVANAAMRVGDILIIEPDSEVKPVLDGFPRKPMTGKRLVAHTSATRKRVVRGPSGGDEMSTKFFRDERNKSSGKSESKQQKPEVESQEFNWIDPDIFAYYEETGKMPDFDDDSNREIETAFQQFFVEEWPKSEYDFLRERWGDLVHNEDAYTRVMGKSALWNAVQLQTTQDMIAEMKHQQAADGEA